MALRNIVGISNLALIQLCLCFVDDSLVSDCKDFTIFNSYVTYTIVEIVSRCKDIVFDCFDCFRIHIGCSKFTGCLTLPVFMYFS